MRWTLRHGLVFLLAVTAGSGALAFAFIGVRWANATAIFNVGMSGSSPSGVTWSTALVDAMNQWNDHTDFNFVANPAYASPCGNVDGINGIDFGSTVCGTSFGNSVLAVTLTLGDRGAFFGFQDLYESNIVFNTARTWDVYDGALRSGTIDFKRVALHEFGHALGLDHENRERAMMAPSISSIYTLQPDDIAGVQALYSGASGPCVVRDLTANSAITDRLAQGDCRVLDMFGGSDDSFVDVYRLSLAQTTTVDIAMSSTELDSVLILANATLGNIEVYDDFNGQCDAQVRKTLPAGEYRILANTYDQPAKCVGNVGGYSLTISDSGMPWLGAVRNATGGTSVPNAIISGGATANGGASFATSFGASQAIDVLARIVPDPLHLGQLGQIYVLATLGDGRQFVLDGNGNFMRFFGGLANLVPARAGILNAAENVSVVSGFRGADYGVAGQTISIHIGYALATAPQQIWYGSTPIRFTLAPQ